MHDFIIRCNVLSTPPLHDQGVLKKRNTYASYLPFIIRNVLYFKKLIITSAVFNNLFIKGVSVQAYDPFAMDEAKHIRKYKSVGIFG